MISLGIAFLKCHDSRMHTVVCILLVSVNVARKCICYMGEAAEYHVNDVVLICRHLSRFTCDFSFHGNGCGRI